jgi:hypothetical protein
MRHLEQIAEASDADTVNRLDALTYLTAKADVHHICSICRNGLAAAIGMFLMHDRSGRAND